MKILTDRQRHKQSRKLFNTENNFVFPITENDRQTDRGGQRHTHRQTEMDKDTHRQRWTERDADGDRKTGWTDRWDTERETQTNRDVETYVQDSDRRRQQEDTHTEKRERKKQRDREKEREKERERVMERRDGMCRNLATKD